MFRRLPFLRTVRFRLTLWYTLTLAVILAASGLFWHIYLTRNLRNHLDERLLIIAEDVASYHFLGQNTQTGHKACQTLEEFIRSHNWGEYVQLLDARGHVQCASNNLKKVPLPFDVAARQSAARGKPFFETIRGIGKHQVRLLTFPVLAQGHLLDMVQVGASLEGIEDTLDELGLILFAFMPLALLALSVGGWFLAGRALSPVVRITRAVNRINAENLNQRLPVEDCRDEITSLAETFNSMLARLEDSFRRIKQFSGDASHELRTPLTILKGETEVALRWAKEPEEFRKMLESNLEEIDRMSRIIENLLLLAKSEAGQLPLEKKKFSLSDLLQELYLQGTTLGVERRIEVALHLDVDEEIYLWGDELRIRQAFLNLISNGIKYNSAGGRLDISLVIDNLDAVVTIADTGIGIPAEHLPHIFDRFYRIDKARNREEGGTGLGLAIVKWIVEVHDGKIDVRSTFGEGSTFTVRLPLQGPAQLPEQNIV